MTQSNYVVFSALLLTAGVPFTYFGYENTFNSVRRNNMDDFGYMFMLVSGILFLVIAVVLFFLSFRKQKMKLK
jgi:tryptophan-rich sensory protein